MRDAEAPPRRRGRRALVALLILLLVLLPLYLWPLRGGGGLPGASALPGPPADPRSAGALARIPPEVWAALMGRGESTRSSGAAPRNLTMIASLEEDAAGGLGPGMLSEDPTLGARAMIAALDGPPPGSTTGPLLSGSPGDEPGTEGSPGGFAFGGYPVPSDLGLGGGGGGLRFPTSGPGGTGDPGTLAPTPEPATLLLVGSNVALLGAAAWRRRRRLKETRSIR